jgi:signal transduction histidine kinase
MMVLVTLASAFDWFRFTGESAFVGMYFIPYAYNGVLFMFGGLLLTLLAQAMLQNQRFSADLEDKVAQRTAELERVHARMLSIEIERSSSMERASLLQDMHDGFGSQLVVAKMMIERQKMTQTDLAQLIQETIDDLHLMVDTLGNSNDYLPNALIDFQFRTQQRMVGSKLQLHWRLELERAPEVSPKAVLQILRIMQEALNNAFKHAQATNIWIEAVCDASQTLLHVAISDDGVGPGSPARRVIGRGQKNMSTRARLLGAELAVVDRGPGTLVRLVVPLRALSAFGQEQTNKMSG